MMRWWPCQVFHWPPNVIFTVAKTESLPKVAQSLSAETDCNPKLSLSKFGAETETKTQLAFN